jgi:hypothetical protein
MPREPRAQQRSKTLARVLLDPRRVPAAIELDVLEVRDELFQAIADQIAGMWIVGSIDTLDGVQPAPTFVDEYDASLAKSWRRLIAYDAEGLPA